MSTVERLIQEARRLVPAELQQLIDALAHLDAPQLAMSEEEFQAHLLKAGIISELPQPISERQPSNFQPIIVQGKALSETIIEERAALVDEICGKYATTAPSTEQFLAWKRAQIELEERRQAAARKE